MGSTERKYELCGPFLPRRHPSLKTSAEIVGDARRILRAQSTQRPYTPRDAHRQLFASNSVRADHSSRPSSTFSLHAQNFDVGDSRPSSGTRLSPLEHKTKIPVPGNDDVSKSSPKPPTDPLVAKRSLVRTRARLLKATSLTKLPPLAAHADAFLCVASQERLHPGPAKKLPPAQAFVSGDHKELSGVPHVTAPGRSQSESRLSQSSVDSGLGSSECRAGPRTDLCGSGKNNTSADSRWDTIAPLLQRLKAAAAGSCEGSPENPCDLCVALYDALAASGMLGPHRSKRRSSILRTLFQLIDHNSPPLHMRVAELCLALHVSGNNLLNICKLIFQISRSEANDVLFQNNSVLDSLLGLLLREDASVCGEALFYCAGTLKFLSGNAAVVRLLLDKNCMSAARDFIQKLCRVDGAHVTIAGHILVQMTAALRNLADHPEARPLFVSRSVISELCTVLRCHRQDQDVCTNVSRIYSKLSSYAECRLALAQTPDCYQLFLELLSKHHQKQDLVVRLLFTLGNLTAESDEARHRLFRCEPSADTLLRLYGDYQPREEDSPPPASAREAEDVLVKLVRVLANVCIREDVGAALAGNATCVQLLMETLELRSVEVCEELTVNVAAAINNLTFYHKESAVLERSQLAIARLMLKLVLSSNMAAMLEATRVYGNLSQSKDVRDFIMQNKVHRFVVTLLDSKNPDVCFSACGVLTNLALDPPNRASLSLEGATTKLTDCLRDLGAGDWQLSAQLCQALWNMSGGDGPEKLLEAQDSESLLEILTSYLDKDKALKWTENEDYHRASWELEFCPVAQKLYHTWSVKCE
ncbi:armadillo repeat-containing protein 2 isoform X1 [Phyllopteryx taeniolatus]|uniref:armadillo repeat-containing protein 2 isoform X1 n=1 Tax=Phyllopteryx taeniolatus TaxID=161469 RepID=UPI002AD3D958|nr:armadillo repeat-containing protein 2 isoform X1 [Phyllopteryx taeniolatus]